MKLVQDSTYLVSMKFNAQRLVVITLVQAIIYVAVYLMNDYTGFLLSMAIAVIAAAVLLISWIADRLEYAGVASWYYPFLLLSVVIPILITLLFWILKSGEMDWMKSPF